MDAEGVIDAEAVNAPAIGGNADVGILGANENSDDEDERPSDLLDVYEALDSATLTGSFASSDIADGSTLTPALPSSPGLRINGVGDISLPLIDSQAKAIKSNRHTAKIQDGSYHKVHSVKGRRLRMKNPAWEGKLASLLQTVAYRLGVDPEKLSAKLDVLLLMEKGSQIKRCANSDEEEDNVIGTLLVQLPSTFKGGKVAVYNEEDEEEEGGESEDEDEDDITAMTFDMGATSGEASFSCHFVCHYKDCEFEMAKVTSGHRALMRYSLLYEGGSELPTANALASSLSTLKWSLRELPPSDRILLIPLAKKYRATVVGRLGIETLSNEHRSRLEAIKVSAGEGWRVLIVNAEMTHIHKTDDYYGQIETISSSQDFSVTHIFDEDGHDVTISEDWLQSALNLTPLDVDSGMILNADVREYDENWGRQCSSATEIDDYDGTKTATSKYVATFILAYDATLVDTELKCLGGSDGVAEVTARVVANRDYSLLKRVLSVVDAKANAEFDVSSCTKVLQMLNKSRGKKATSSKRIDFVKKTLSGLDSSEPDTELYDAIRATADRFGHENIEVQIAGLLSDADRRSDLQLHLFLLRCDFILKLSNGGHENNLLEEQCRQLPHFGADSIEDSGVINSTIDSLMAEHGWEAVVTVVAATLRFMHSKHPANSGIPKLLDRARLLQKISGHPPYGFVQTCFVDFAKDFTKSLVSTSENTATRHLQGDNKQIFVKAICYVMERGAKVDLGNLGKWSIKSKNVFPRVLEVIVEQADALGFEARNLLHEMLNRCLVQNSCGYAWRRLNEVPEKVPHSLHVRKVIADYPDMTRTPGRDGRLTLHCAVATKLTSFDTITDVFESYPQAASIRCPQSGLYPFMLAASNCPPPPREGAPAYPRHQIRTDMDRSKVMIGASFRLLLADPSLVAGGIPVDDEGSKKRKRSASMDGQESEQA